MIVRHVNRRIDPLKRRTPEDWVRAFARMRKITPAVIVAAKRVCWDYPRMAPALRPLTEKYLEIRVLPPLGGVQRALARVGYPPWQIDRSTRSYAAGHRKDARSVNIREHEIRERIGAEWRDENEEDRHYGRPPLPEIRLKV